MSAILKQKLIDIANGFTKYGLWKGGGSGGSSALSEMSDVTFTNLQTEGSFGGFYKDNRSLSERIWNNVNGSMQDIQYILTKGMASNKSYLEIIKDLESYVNPFLIKFILNLF